MFSYRRRLFFPVHVERPNPVYAQALLEHCHGKDGELATAVQYLIHSLNMPNRYIRELLGLLAAEELGHTEIIGVAINKLGGPALKLVNPQGQPWDATCVDQALEPAAMLEADAEAECRTQALYKRQLDFADDPGLQRMFNFLASREEVHLQLVGKAQTLIRQGSPPEEFNELIYEYRMSLQVLE